MPMTIQELQVLATRGCRREDDSGRPGEDEMLAGVEITSKAKELFDEIGVAERWDKDIIGRKAATILWFCARLTGMYGVNLEHAVKQRADEAKTESPAPEKPAVGGTHGKNNAKIIFGPEGKPASLSRLGRPAQRRRPSGSRSGARPNT